MAVPDSRGKRGSKLLSGLKRIRKGVWSDGSRKYYFNETTSNNLKDTSFTDVYPYIGGTTDEITVTDNGNGTVTLSLPDSIKLDGATAFRLLATDGTKKTVSVTDLTNWIAGTTDQIIVTDDTDGTVTLSTPQSIATDSDVTFNTVTVASYTRHIQVQAIPSGTIANQAVGNTVGTAVGLQFASTPDKYAGFQWEVPDDWVGGEDITVEVDWTPDSGAMSGTDTVQWILEYRSIASGELLTQGAIATVTVTNNDDNAQYTSIHSSFTIDYDHADQPLTKQDHVFFLLHRNTTVANDFAGTVTVTAFEIVYNSNTIPKSN
jgi:hypothetical protein